MIRCIASYVASYFHHRFLKMYKNPKKGDSYRKNLLARHTNMLLFQGEVETIVGQVTQQLGVKGTMYIAI